MHELVANTLINEFVGLIILTNIEFNDKEDLYDFAEIDDDYGFNICNETDIESLSSYEECLEVMDNWKEDAINLYLDRRQDILDGLTED